MESSQGDGDGEVREIGGEEEKNDCMIIRLPFMYDSLTLKTSTQIIKTLLQLWPQPLADIYRN